MTEPLGYRENLGLMAEARFVSTDSGGIQEETSLSGHPVPDIAAEHGKAGDGDRRQ